jgi:serine/threonine protein kinase/tetratricopeptide (TPR) repeat protein
MNPERLEQIDRIFHSTLDLPPEQRPGFLASACGDDLRLRAEVESLIAAHQSAGTFIEDSASDVAASLLKNKPQQVGQYSIEKLLGAGGMGEVYLAKDRLGRRVAVKLLASHLHGDQQQVARFLQEAQTLLALNHPNIVTIYDIGETGESYYIASEFIEGESLRQRIGSDDLNLGAVLEIAMQVAMALAAAHEKGIVHRDIKPDNVMIRRDGYVKVLDFGVAKLTTDFAAVNTEAPTQPKVETAEGIVIGTARYMSPEQARGVSVDARTDIWSCGVLLYEMLAGKAPFGGGTAAEIVVGILDREPAPLARYMTDPPAELQRIVNKTLVKDREHRYQTVRDLLLDLRALKQELEFTAKLKRSDQSSVGPVAEQSPAGNNSSAVKVIAEPKPSTTARGSSAEYIATELKKHKRGVALLIGFLLLASVGLTCWLLIDRSHDTATNASIDSIAVMPFENVTHDENNDYLSDGITDSLINRLSQLPQVRVIPRNSVFSYKNQIPNLQQVAKQLSVKALLTGRVVMQGDTIDVRVELTNAASNTQLWGDHYTRKVADLFAVQDEIAQQVTNVLRVRLTRGQQEQVSKRYTENAEAWRLYLLGRYYLNQGTEKSNKRALSLFDEAINLDPRFAVAYAARANTFFSMGDISVPMNEAVAKARQNATTALNIDNTLSEARLVLANIKFQYDWNFSAADEDFKQLFVTDPNYAEGHHQYTYLFAMKGQPNLAVTEINLAQQLDPVNQNIVADMALPYFLSGDFDRAVETSRKTLEMYPNFWLPHMTLGCALFEKGDIVGGIAELEKARSLDVNPIVLGNLGYAYAKAGRKDEARKLMAQLTDESKARYVAAYYIAFIYVGLGEKDQAFSWFEKAYRDRSWWLVWLNVEPRMDQLRSDARFTELLHRIGFPQGVNH